MEEALSGQMGFRALMQTKPTLKWFIVIGIVILVIGILLSFVSIVGILIAWIGVLLVGFSVIALFYLWLTDKYLPQPSMERVTFLGG